MKRRAHSQKNFEKKPEYFDLAILGAGPAGLTAAIYAGRYNLKTIIISKIIGGTATQAGRVENWPGFIGSGTELMQKFKKQAEEFDTQFLGAEISKVRKEKNQFLIETEKKEIYAKTIIIALGTENRRLGIEGEKKFLGKGVSYCATCDGFFFKDKKVIVIGGADSCAKTALYLSNFAKEVYIIYRKGGLRCEPTSLQKINGKRNIKILYNSVLKRIKGKNSVNQVEIETDADNKIKNFFLDIDGIFIEIGSTPATEILSELKIKMEKEYIITDKHAKTNIGGIFAAGDITNNNLKQIVTAAGEGAIAAKSAYDYLRFK